jgi:hypothetical protein
MRARKKPPDCGLLPALVDTEEFVRLQAKLPTRVSKTVVDRGPGIRVALRVVQRLQV